MCKAKLGSSALLTTRGPRPTAHGFVWKATLGWLALVVLTAGILGCTGQPRVSHPTMAAMGGAAMGGVPAGGSPQFAQSSVLPAGMATKPSEYGKMAPRNRSPWNTVTGMLTNNPINASVQKAWHGMTHPAGPPQAVATDSLALSNQRQEPTASLYISMGQLAEKHNNIDQARLHYQKALEIAPTDTQALLAYGHMEDRQERLDEALTLYSRAVESNPSDATAQNDLGLCLARKDDMPAAARALSRAIELKPRQTLYRNNLAAILIKLDRMDEALAQLTAVHPPAVAHYNMGYLLQKYGQETLAVEHFVTASRLDPSMQTAHAWLAKLQPTKNVPVAVTQTKNSHTENTRLLSSAPQQGTVAAAQSGTSRLPMVVGPVVAEDAYSTPATPSSRGALPGHGIGSQPRVVLPALPPTPPVPQVAPNLVNSVPQVAPNLPTIPPQSMPNSGPYHVPATDASPWQAASPVEPDQSPWPLHQPSEVPNTNLGASAAQPPVPTIPATVTNVYVHQIPQPLPPVRQASAVEATRR